MKFQVGDKVVPINKTHGCHLESSISWKKANKVGQKFLYVIKVDNSGVYSCNEDNNPYYGDWFNESDLTLYKKSKNQRIAELEEKLELFQIKLEQLHDVNQDLVSRIGALENGPKTMREQIAELEPLITLTPNQQRAEIIEKAKKFVEEQKNRYGHYEIYDEKGVSRKCIADFKFNVEKRTIVVLLRGFESNKIYIRGIAKCFPLDVFNEHIGKAIALGRALGLDVSEFEQAVQPDEVVKGTEVFYRRDGYASTFTQIVESVGDVEMANQDLNVKDDKGWSCKIINDTNAQYEEVK